ncbi:unnamed protein product [Effrenium voratum]|uniref:Uncharacterized protein n=1 Tax=Effrenium voratum TaxID=2562239 RepID=A0AA36NLH0_9DINO|nr:unnamed protein product [Effrenium voratum]CAJ1451049.1 unnamed protein product [Effrenium voratum]
MEASLARLPVEVVRVPRPAAPDRPGPRGGRHAAAGGAPRAAASAGCAWGLALLARRRRIRRVLRRAGPEAPVTLREQAQQLASDQAALRMGSGGLESVVPEDERKQLEKKADTLEPFRKGVILAACLLLFGALQDGFWLLVTPGLTAQGWLNVIRSEDSQSSSLALILGLTAVGAGLLYTGLVLLAPAPLPSLESVLQEEESRQEAEKNRQLRSLEGRWYYGLNLGQSYRIFQSERGWRFEEELQGRKCTAELRIVGGWVKGQLLDQHGKEVGLIRLRRSAGKSVVSNLRPVGEADWGNPNEAIGW